MQNFRETKGFFLILGHCNDNLISQNISIYLKEIRGNMETWKLCKLLNFTKFFPNCVFTKLLKVKDCESRIPTVQKHDHCFYGKIKIFPSNQRFQ